MSATTFFALKTIDLWTPPSNIGSISLVLKLGLVGPIDSVHSCHLILPSMFFLHSLTHFFFSSIKQTQHGETHPTNGSGDETTEPIRWCQITESNQSALRRLRHWIEEHLKEQSRRFQHCNCQAWTKRQGVEYYIEELKRGEKRIHAAERKGRSTRKIICAIPGTS